MGGRKERAMAIQEGAVRRSEGGECVERQSTDDMTIEGVITLTHHRISKFACFCGISSCSEEMCRARVER